jgi:DNA helicase HerA-like ATPase
MSYELFLGKGEQPVFLRAEMANRHGLIAGATGTGKTVSLRVMAEAFSRIGVPVFMADVKGDLAGLAFPGELNPKIQERVTRLGMTDFTCEASPVVFWDVLGQQGHPVRATVSDLGPLLLGRLLELNETQNAVLQLIFKAADDNGLLILDLKDLEAVVKYVGENAKQFAPQYGNIAGATLGTIQRGLVALGDRGAAKFFGEPALSIDDLMQVKDGRGTINILAADQLMESPVIYSTMLLWLLAELFEHLPEIGDPEKPRLVFFFDEAHLLFNEAPKALLTKIEQVVRLIRSKGVGVYFVSQSPLDIPEIVLGQLGNRVQHALRAFTPRDQKSVRAAAETFRGDGKLNVAQAITDLNVGEALVSVLDARGAPTIVERTWIAPPRSRLGSITPAERTQIIQRSPLFGHYEKEIDRESAFELLQKKAAGVPGAPATAEEKPAAGRSRISVFTAFVTSTARSVGSSLGRAIVRGVMDSLKKPRRR